MRVKRSSFNRERVLWATNERKLRTRNIETEENDTLDIERVVLEADAKVWLVELPCELLRMRRSLCGSRRHTMKKSYFVRRHVRKSSVIDLN